MEEVAKAGGWEQHHIQNLQKELELKKQEVELMKEMAKITPETWGSIKESVKGLNSFGQGGGVSAMETAIEAVLVAGLGAVTAQNGPCLTTTSTTTQSITTTSTSTLIP